MNVSLFIASWVTFFVVADPIGTSAVFSVLTNTLKRKQANALAVQAVLTALVLYAFFGYFGMKVLGYMSISLTAFRLTGGLLLFVTAFRMIMGRHDDSELASSNSVYADRKNLAVFPLAIPLLAGPGCLTALLLLLNHAQTSGETYTVIAALLCVQATALAAFLLVGELKRFLGPGPMVMIARVMGILLASMATQFIIDGIKEVTQALQ
jgi:multiple antibiotic resistance protein